MDDLEEIDISARLDVNQKQEIIELLKVYT
jgi:hypothetical protein